MNLNHEFVPVRLPDWMPVVATKRGYPVAELRNWLHREATGLAQRFDERNGTPYYMEQIQERAGLQQWALPAESETTKG
jgi:hypothetical protein